MIAYTTFKVCLSSCNSCNILFSVTKVGVLDEEKILPLGKDITAIGVCSSKDGILEIKSCEDLPYFL